MVIFLSKVKYAEIMIFTIKRLKINKSAENN